ncbi:pilus assembly PilX N-terminal domain-containing protein [Shewanella sp. 1_MG-2023]|uniref:pilus assembly PilX family protein n=1 Tax=unclassified Shewanella TaxID=196818 RepID=UPI000C824452|nr:MULTISPECIES: PilX N-terminal domain-containing pilus assembly protein [unclassified Shewanella]MDO6610059.1 pilus assembly PilX N-terminal domain-containing protein [Shewanella sp. 7_MG-2023]MDO6769799.1 pilus assembly PilX N-terminal domain-containing protein [Shewanella sp. 2_MG-2023]MDO6792863.1 pilus assembly PilX N-terminal domain-containing protein [Shewanella sp. 1_MG-2023]PMG71647.1 pilus assembly protein PilX [Shewanella sp. 10N.286.51.B7]
MKKQQGVVLFFSLIVLVIMTVIGVALAVNSTQSLRMSGAGSERIEAMVSAQGGQEKMIADNSGATMANMVAETVMNDAALGVVNTVTPMTVGVGDDDCQRSPKANSANMIKCKRLEVSSSANFGRSNLGRVTIVLGFEQEVLSGS